MSNKQRITISIDIAQYEFHGLGARNASEYVNQLLIDRTRVDNFEKFYEKISERLAQDPVFAKNIRFALTGNQPTGGDYSEPETYA